MMLTGAHWLRTLALQHRGELDSFAGAPSPQSISGNTGTPLYTARCIIAVHNEG